jgi:hypothetical protein
MMIVKVMFNAFFIVEAYGHDTTKEKSENRRH